MLRTVTAVIVVATLAVPAIAQEKRPASLAGKWRGTVVADIGEMAIAVTVQVAKEIASGSIETGHGTFTITKGTFADGKWTLPFESPDGMKGRLIGTVTDKDFTGDWDFRPMALGKFTLTRDK
jgi:hypothetical protein